MTITPNKWELDVQGYLNVCNITAATPRKQIRDFSAGVNDLGLWNLMVCWPLRSSQNYGSGTTAFSLGGLGTFNGTLLNGPSWGADGITADGSFELIFASFNFATARPSLFSVFSPNSTDAGVGSRFISNDQAGTSTGIGFDDIPAGAFRRLASGDLITFGTRSASIRTMVGLGFGEGNTFTFQNGTRTTQTDVTYTASNQVLCIIGSPGATTAFGEYSFAAAFDGPAPNASVLSSFYNTYKSTLGTGLSLP